MAKKKEQVEPVDQAETFGPTDERDELIERLNEDPPEEEGMLENEPEPEVDPEVVDPEPDASIPEIEPEPDEHQRLKSEYENLKGQNTEEREKRKAKNRELEDVKSQLHEVLQDYKKLSEQRQPEEEYEGDGDPKLYQEIKQLRAEVSKLSKERSSEKAETAEQRYKQSLSDTDKKLAEEGFPGFNVSRAAVQDALIEMVREDRDNVILDNPEGWKKIYKEKVYPLISAGFSKIDKKAAIDKKIEDKKKGNLVTLPGKNPEKNKAKDEEWTHADYLAERRKQQIS